MCIKMYLICDVCSAFAVDSSWHIQVELCGVFTASANQAPPIPTVVADNEYWDGANVVETNFKCWYRQFGLTLWINGCFRGYVRWPWCCLVVALLGCLGLPSASTSTQVENLSEN